MPNTKHLNVDSKGKHKDQSSNEFEIDVYQIKLPSIPNYSPVLKPLTINIDRIICHFLMAFTYLVVAIEEADYMILLARSSKEEKNLIDVEIEDIWSLKMLLERFSS